MISPQHQTFEQWQQSPLQGAIPSSTPVYFHSLLEDLLLAESYLQGANTYSSLLQSNTPKLAEALGDALTSCQRALAILNNLSDYTHHEN